MGKSGGVSEKDKEFRGRFRNNSIKKYFYGTIDCPLSPPTVSYSFSSFNFYKIVRTLNDAAISYFFIYYIYILFIFLNFYVIITN